MPILDFKQYQALTTLRNLIPVATRKIISALSTKAAQLQVAHSIHQPSPGIGGEYNDPRRDEWNLLFTDPDEYNKSFQDWTKGNPPALFQFGQKGDRILTEFADGGSNRIYFAINQKVIKITEDGDEAIIVALAVKGGKIPNIAVEDVVRLNTFAQSMNLEQLFAIKQDFVDTNISGEMVAAANALQSYISMVGGHTVVGIRNDPRASVKASRMDPFREPFVKLILDVIFVLLDKTGYLWTDTHPANIAQDKEGRPVLFDLGEIYPAGKPRPAKIRSV